MIVRHVSDDYEAKGEHMNKCLSLVKCHVCTNLEAKFVRIPREENMDANRLAIAASLGSMTLNRQVLSFIQYSLATNEVDGEAPRPQHC